MAATADFRNGLCIAYTGKPCSIAWFQHANSGRGGALVGKL
ncbi:MAG: hypothetical protein LBG47_00350 [Prevotellaceae bacterium]|nr:hypothetical protein [Prevotellaceae bacterium]